MAPSSSMTSVCKLIVTWSLVILVVLNGSYCDTAEKASATENVPKSSGNLQRLSRAHLEFALSLFRNMANGASEEENVVVSPYSIASVLTQLWLGTEENSTESDSLASVLHYDSVGLQREQVHEAFLNSLKTFKDSSYKNIVQSANAMFVQMGTEIKSEFDADLRKYYNSTVDEVDFKNGESIARSIINRWVMNQTHGQISKILDAPLPTDTVLLLVNAFVFKAFWKHSFDPLGTTTSKFYTTASKTIDIPTMVGKFQVMLGISPELNCRLLELPFRGRRLSMFIVLPGTGISSGEQVLDVKISEVETKFTAENLKKLFSSLTEETVTVTMPKFRIAESSNVADTLKDMGLETIFGQTANFSRITPTEPFHVGTIAHKVVFEVTEKGAQAAAVTSTGIERLGDFGEEKLFEINRPFLFFIWDYHSGALLFVGRVASPESL